TGPCVKDRDERTINSGDIRRATVREPGRSSDGVDVHELAALAVAELDDAVGGREQRVVATLADVLAGVELRAALAHDDGAGPDRCARVDLHAESLGRGVTPVAGGRGTLLLRHGSLRAPGST